MNPEAQPSKRPSRLGHRWALVFPFVWQAGLAPLVNDISLKPLGMPFPMVWQMAGIVLTSLVIAWVFRRDAQLGVEAEEAAFLSASASEEGGHP